MKDWIKQLPKQVTVVDQGTIDGLEYAITDVQLGVSGIVRGYNGYVYFPKEMHPTKETGDEAEVHGGVTLSNEHKGGRIYGFDTAHSFSGEYPIRDMEWIKQELRGMIDSILSLLKEAKS